MGTEGEGGSRLSKFQLTTLQKERESLETSFAEQTDNVEELRLERDSFHERDEQLKKDVGSMFGEW